MKIVFAARMAMWDVPRATQSLASRGTKWSRDCDTALHRLVCYINSSLDIRMQGFMGDIIAEFQLWLSVTLIGLESTTANPLQVVPSTW